MNVAVCKKFGEKWNNDCKIGKNGGRGGGRVITFSLITEQPEIISLPVFISPSLFIFCKMQSTQTFIATAHGTSANYENQSAQSYIYSFHFFLCFSTCAKYGYISKESRRMLEQEEIFGFG